MTTTIILTLNAGKRLRNTPGGNPQWQLFFNDGAVVLRIVPDAQVAYRVEELMGKELSVTINDLGYITEMEPVPQVP